MRPSGAPGEPADARSALVDPGQQVSAGLLAIRYLDQWSQGRPGPRDRLKLAFRFLPVLLLPEPVYCLTSGCVACVVSSLASCWFAGRTAFVAWCAAQVAVCLIAGIALDPVTGRVRRVYLQPYQVQQPGDREAALRLVGDDQPRGSDHPAAPDLHRNSRAATRSEAPPSSRFRP